MFLLYIADTVHVSIVCRINITKSSLTIRPVLLADAGIFACLAENQWGQAWLNFTLDIRGTHQYLHYLVIIMNNCLLLLF